MVPKTTKKNLDSISDRIKNTKLRVKDLVIPIVIAIILVLITYFTCSYDYKGN